MRLRILLAIVGQHVQKGHANCIKAYVAEDVSRNNKAWDGRERRFDFDLLFICFSICSNLECLEKLLLSFFLVGLEHIFP